MTDIFTCDLSQLGYREIDILADMLKLYANGKTVNNIEYPISVSYNLDSDNAFIIDDNENQFLVNDNDKLEQWFNCWNCGKEGFEIEFTHKDTRKTNCEQCLESIGIEQIDN